MSKIVEFFADVTSPNVYLAYHAMQPMLARTGARLVIKPALLGGIFKATGNVAPFFTMQKVKGRFEYEQLELRRFIAAHGLTRFKWTPHFPHNTVLAMRAAVAAEEAGVLTPYLEAALAAVWEEERDLSDAETLFAVISAAGLDAPTFLAAAGRDDIKAKLRDATDAAVARGVFGMPSFFVGGEMYFGKERLAQIEAVLM